jgi:hypothetical protein
MRYLVFTGGAYGMRMGNTPSQRHRTRVQDCTFHGQTIAGVRIDDAGQSRGTDPRFFQTTFRAAPRGIEVVATTARAVVFPDIEECTFTGLTGSAIRVDHNSTGGNVGALIRSNWFRNCAQGVHVTSRQAATTTNFEVYSCSFADITAAAVHLELDQATAPAATIDRCAFLRCGTGVALRGNLAAGEATLDLHHSVFSACAQDGLALALVGNGTCAVTAHDNLFELCHVGCNVAPQLSAVQLTMLSTRDRLLRNTTGIAVRGGNASSSVTLRSAMVCGNTARALQVLGPATLTGQSLTIADNAIGLETPATPTLTTLTHCILDGNATNIAGTATVTYTCLQGSTHPGIGNLFTNPLLIRPLYKLSPFSPCLDRGDPAAALPATDYEGDARASISRVNGNAHPDLGADEYVLSGSARKYGLIGFGYFNFFPEIGSANSRVVIGEVLNVELTNAVLRVFGTPARDAFLAMGFRDDAAGLPFDLSVINAPGSLLWNDLVAVLGLFPVSAQGTASVPLFIPAVPLLVGHTFTFQWFAHQRSANQISIVATDGLRVTIGQ